MLQNSIVNPNTSKCYFNRIYGFSLQFFIYNKEYVSMSYPDLKSTLTANRDYLRNNRFDFITIGTFETNDYNHVYNINVGIATSATVVGSTLIVTYNDGYVHTFNCIDNSTASQYLIEFNHCLYSVKINTNLLSRTVVSITPSNFETAFLRDYEAASPNTTFVFEPGTYIHTESYDPVELKDNVDIHFKDGAIYNSQLTTRNSGPFHAQDPDATTRITGKGVFIANGIYGNANAFIRMNESSVYFEGKSITTGASMTWLAGGRIMMKFNDFEITSDDTGIFDQDDQFITNSLMSLDALSIVCPSTFEYEALYGDNTQSVIYYFKNWSVIIPNSSVIKIPAGGDYNPNNIIHLLGCYLKMNQKSPGTGCLVTGYRQVFHIWSCCFVGVNKNSLWMELEPNAEVFYPESKKGLLTQVFIYSDMYTNLKSLPFSNAIKFYGNSKILNSD